jgi:nitrogen fixation/metabolism regulation signal transduction histidine kinase
MNDPKRTWRDIARKLASEENPLRCIELSEELTQTMDEEERQKERTVFVSATPAQGQRANLRSSMS